MAAVIPQLFTDAEELKAAGFALKSIRARREPQAILMCEPTYFSVLDCKNPFMTGNEGACDTALAKEQWAALKATYEQLGRTVYLLPAVEGLEDMVFSANQVLPGERADGARFVILANMVHESRRKEVPHYAAWFEAHGYSVLRISPTQDKGPRFEGQGDAIWHPGRSLLWGGFGHRTEPDAYRQIAKLAGVDVLLLELVSDTFYHLDTAFCALDESTVMICREAFSDKGYQLIKSVFARVLEIPVDEARANFAGNALALGRDVVLQRGAVATCSLLREAGFNPLEVDTSEFMKSGGSVFCLKMMVY